MGWQVDRAVLSCPSVVTKAEDVSSVQGQSGASTNRGLKILPSDSRMLWRQRISLATVQSLVSARTVSVLLSMDFVTMCLHVERVGRVSGLSD